MFGAPNPLAACVGLACLGCFCGQATSVGARMLVGRTAEELEHPPSWEEEVEMPTPTPFALRPGQRTFSQPAGGSRAKALSTPEAVQSRGTGSSPQTEKFRHTPETTASGQSADAPPVLEAVRGGPPESAPAAVPSGEEMNAPPRASSKENELSPSPSSRESGNAAFPPVSKGKNIPSRPLGVLLNQPGPRPSPRRQIQPKSPSHSEANPYLLAPQGRTSPARALESGQENPAPALPAGSSRSSRKEPKRAPRALGASETIDQMFPVGPPTPEKDPLGREIREKIHDLGAEPHRRQKAVERLAVIGVPAVPALRAALRDSYPFTRIGALNALGYIRAPESVPDIENLLQDPEPDVRAEAAATLGRMRVSASTRAVADLLHDPDMRVKRTAIIALGRFRTPIAREMLIGALKSQDVEIRRQAAQELSAFQNRSVVDALLQATYDLDPKTCGYAVRSLGEIGDPAAVDRLKALSQKSNRFIREEARDALQLLGSE